MRAGMLHNTYVYVNILNQPAAPPISSAGADSVGGRGRPLHSGFMLPGEPIPRQEETVYHPNLANPIQENKLYLEILTLKILKMRDSQVLFFALDQFGVDPSAQWLQSPTGVRRAQVGFLRKICRKPRFSTSNMIICMGFRWFLGCFRQDAE